MTKPIVWKTVKIQLGKLREWDKNPVKISKREMAELAKSLDKFDHVTPYVAASPIVGGFADLLDGHQRKMVELQVNKISPKTMVDVRVPDRKLTEKERKEIVVRLRKNTGEFDFEKLELNFDVSDLLEWGFDEKELEKNGFTLEDKSVDAEPQIDRAAELAEKWQTATGQLWKLGDHRLLIGDCTVRENVEMLMGGERADMVFTDPPFGNNKGYGRGQLGIRYIEGDQNTDILFKLPEIIDSILSGSFFVVWVQWYTYADLFSAFSGKEIDTVIIWDKKSPGLSGGGGYGEQYEMAVVFANGKPKHRFFRGNVFTESRHVEGGERNPHPTMKSVKVCQDIIIDLSAENKIIVDFFAGSGTTIIAAHNLNRRCYAMEISPAYCGVILERFFTATGITPKLTK